MSSPSATPHLELIGSRQLPSWMAEQDVSFAFTTNQTGKLFLIGLQPDQRLSVFERTFNHSAINFRPHQLKASRHAGRDE